MRVSMCTFICRHYEELGHLIIYISSRPDFQKETVLKWLGNHQFPLGIMSFNETLSKDLNLHKKYFLGRLIKEVGFLATHFVSIHAAAVPAHVTTLCVKSYHLKCAGREELPFSWFMLCRTWLCFMPSSYMSLLPQKKEVRTRCCSCRVSRSDSVYRMHLSTHPHMHIYIIPMHYLHTSRAKSPFVLRMVHGEICKSTMSLVCNQTRSSSLTREARSRTQRSRSVIARLAGPCSLCLHLGSNKCTLISGFATLV